MGGGPRWLVRVVYGGVRPGLATSLVLLHSGRHNRERFPFRLHCGLRQLLGCGPNEVGASSPQGRGPVATNTPHGGGRRGRRGRRGGGVPVSVLLGITP